MRRFLMSALMLTTASLPAGAFTFGGIDGADMSLDQWRGQPVLVVNTASRCGFTYQYDGLQALYDAYRDQGLVVLTVPSNSFRQEFATGKQVKEFCAVNFALDLPMTELTDVRGREAHPFYQWIKQETGFVPNWNFNKILIAPDGTVAGTWRSSTKPMSAAITGPIETLLDG
ncbi:MAG: glutathione peroxidase [Pseudomonadota bacterium]